jgi:DNA-binding winged helix-turn-helix (wHTH) protein
MDETERALVYRFGDFTLDVHDERLLRRGVTIHLKPKAFQLLLLFLRRSGVLLTKDELMQHMWPDTFVEEHNLAVNISELRRALGQNQGPDVYIETVPHRGYRFVADVETALRSEMESGTRTEQTGRDRRSVSHLFTSPKLGVKVVFFSLLFLPFAVIFMYITQHGAAMALAMIGLLLGMLQASFAFVYGHRRRSYLRK